MWTLRRLYLFFCYVGRYHFNDGLPGDFRRSPGLAWELAGILA